VEVRADEYVLKVGLGTSNKWIRRMTSDTCARRLVIRNVNGDGNDGEEVRDEWILGVVIALSHQTQHVRGGGGNTI
jgi:hypothetical protein